MTWVKRVLLWGIGLVLLLAIVGLLLPRKVHLERSTMIDAPRATVFTLVNGYRNFNKWSPWFALDPSAKYTFEGASEGVGAKMSWVGDPGTIGSGSQEIIESKPFVLVRTKLDFGAGLATATFALAAEGQKTRVTWSLDADMGMNPVSRYFGLVFDSMMGGDLEKGLAGLKKLAESLPADGPKAESSDSKRGFPSTKHL